MTLIRDPEVVEAHTNEAFEVTEDEKQTIEKMEMQEANNNAKKDSWCRDDEGPEDEHVCKVLGILPVPCGKFFLTAPWILVFLCWASTIQGMAVNGFVNVVISTLERRFELLSSTTGLIAGCYDIGSMIAVIPISYFGGRLGISKPKYISFGLVMMGIGSLLFSLPHFISDPYLETVPENATNVQIETCSSNPNEPDCTDFDSESGSSLSRFKYFFVFGQICHGIGAAALITLGTTLLDESVSKKNSPLYIGIFQTMFVVGPAVGYIAGGQFLDLYVDFDIVDSDFTSENGLTPSSPIWVGAWWLGFIVSWLMAWACAFIIGMYPVSLPGSGKHNQVKEEDGFGSLRDLPKAIKVLLMNPTYMFINLGGAMDGFSVSGLAAFLPKFFQSQYGLTAGTAAFVVGLILVPGGGGGTLAGGYITKRFRLTRSQVIKMYMWCQLVTVPMCIAFLLNCPNPEFSGVNAGYGLSNAPAPPSVNFSAECNADCSCSKYEFDPVCGTDNKMYFNPCFAGCTTATIQISDDEVQANNYTDCGCVNDDSQMALKEHCDVHCNYMIGFMICIFITIFFTFMSAMPNVVATLRAVEPVHRSLALGIESIFLRCLGTIPGPVVFGYLIDQTCQLWQERACTTDTGNCLFYDNWHMAINMLIVTIAVKAMGIFFFAFALFFSKRSHIPDDPGE